MFKLGWLPVSAEEHPSLGAPRPANGTADSPDLRSPVGRVPPYQPQGGAIGVGPIPMQVPGFWPHNPHTRVDLWHRKLYNCWRRRFKQADFPIEAI